MAGVYWLLNKVFGKTHIFIVILGWFLIITGLLMLWQPETARRSMANKGFSIIKAYVLVLVMFAAAWFVSEMNKRSGLLALVALIAGIVILVRGVLFFQKAAAERINAWAGKVPLKYLRLYAAVQVAVGIVMHMLRQRMIFY